MGKFQQKLAGLLLQVCSNLLVTGIILLIPVTSNMPNKPLGGRGKCENYSTSVVRVPDPIKPQVLELIEDFHQNRVCDASKPVTGLFRIPVAWIVEMIEAAYPQKWEGETVLIHCDISWSWWNKKFDKAWERESRPRVKKFNELADRVNRCIWQIDNTFAIAHPKELPDAVGRLAEYNLLEKIDNRAPLVPAKDLIDDWIFEGRESFNDVIWDAFREKRFDILRTLRIGEYPPIERRKYWHQKYTEQLGKPEVNYWKWRENPESGEICPELTILLKLPEPSPDACKVLECLAEGKDPFFKPEVKGNTSDELFMFALMNMGKTGSLANYKPEQKQAYRQAFIHWHESTLAALGQKLLEQIYKVVYKCNWDLIEAIINLFSGEWWEVLGVTPNASVQEVKAARQRLAKKWHPDVNSSPLAKERMTKINQAVDEFSCNRFR